MDVAVLVGVLWYGLPHTSCIISLTKLVQSCIGRTDVDITYMYLFLTVGHGMSSKLNSIAL